MSLYVSLGSKLSNLVQLSMYINPQETVGKGGKSITAQQIYSMLTHMLIGLSVESSIRWLADLRCGHLQHFCLLKGLAMHQL